MVREMRRGFRGVFIFGSTEISDGGGMRRDDVEWAEVRRLYCEEGVSYALLAVRFGVGARTISRRSEREGWSKDRIKPARSGASQSLAPMPTPESRRLMLARLYRAICRKLEHMEARMTSGESRSAQDDERESRSLSVMIRNFEKVTEVVSELDRTSGLSKRDTSAAGADAERMRLEIAERVKRLARGRDADGGSGGTE